MEATPINTTISSSRLISVDLFKLLPLIQGVSSETHDAENYSYLSAALEQVSLAKEFQLKDDYSASMIHMSKAVKRIEELIDLRKNKEDEDQINEYSVIESGFLYQQGNILVSYIETKSDVFGNVPALDIEESESSEDDVAEEVRGQEGQPETEQLGGDEEPRIEDDAEIAARKKLESLEEEKVSKDAPEDGEEGAGQKEEESPSAVMVEDATENLLACIQLSEDFINNPSVSSEDQTKRKEVLSNLLIDSYIRLGDIVLFKEDIPGAIDSYKKAVEYCKDFTKGNERLLTSTLFTIGCCHQQSQNNIEAGKSFQEAINSLRIELIKKLHENNQLVDTDTSNDKLITPSIFDLAIIKELKEFLKDLLEKLQETQEQEKIAIQLQELKKKEGEEVQVDENFGKPMQNSHQFKDMTATIKIGKKRTQPEMMTAGKEPEKRQKLDTPPKQGEEEAKPVNKDNV